MRSSVLIATLALACGPSEGDEAEIGPDGGTVSSDGASVEVPAGALDEATPIAVSEVVPDTPPPADRSAAGPAIAFTPHGTTFAEAVTLQIPYDSASVELEVFRLDDASDTSWERVEATFDEDRAEVSTTTFSIYQVMEPGSEEDTDTEDTDTDGDSDPPAVDFDVIRVDSDLLLSIDPSRGWNQFFGSITFTNVSSVSPSGATVPGDLVNQARVACLANWDELAEDAIAAVRMYRIGDNGAVTSINPPNWWVPEGSGLWSSKGGDQESGATVEARSGYWDANHNRRAGMKLIDMEVPGDTLVVQCHAGHDVQATYP